MFGLNPLLLAGASAIAIGGAWWLGHESGVREREGKIAHNFVETLALERQVAIRREVNLWTLIGDSHEARDVVIGKFERIDQLSTEARANMLAALRQERESAQAAMQQAQANIQELKDAASQMAKDWKAGIIPPDITCGVFDATGCPGPAYPSTSSDPDRRLDVRDGAAGQGGGR